MPKHGKHQNTKEFRNQVVFWGFRVFRVFRVFPAQHGRPVNDVHVSPVTWQSPAFVFFSVFLPYFAFQLFSVLPMCMVRVV